MRGRGAAALAAIAAFGLLGCGRSTELELRFEAERLRWRIDREEERLRGTGDASFAGELETVRALHAEVDRRFGAPQTPSPDMLRNADALLRLRIAGASSLYGADLAARYAPNDETVREYERLATVYAFDRDLAVRALFGQGRLLEKLGRPEEALGAYRALLDRYPPVPPRGHEPPERAPAVGGRWLDLEIHVLAMSKELGEADFAVKADLAIERLRERAEAWRETRSGPELSRRAAQALFVRDRWMEGVALLAAMREEVEPGEARAAAGVEIGEILARGAGDAAAAEKVLRECIPESPGSLAESSARLRLGAVLVEAGRPAEALVELDALLGLRARQLEGRAGEAGFRKAQALARLGRWEDALPAFDRVASLDDVGCWSLLSRPPLIERSKVLRVPGGELRAARESVEIARRIPTTEPPDPAFGWDGFWNRPLRDALWREGIAFLRQLAAAHPREDFAAAALEQAARLERERLFAVRIGADSTQVKSTS